jgi:hypothetical protein
MIARVVLSTISTAVALAALLYPREPVIEGPVLVVRAVAAPAAAAPPSEDDEDVAMALAVASIDPAERARILEEMRYTTARLEARLSSLVPDFGDDDVDPIDEFRRAMAAHVPSFTAARTFERSAWTTSDLTVRLARSCAEARPEGDEVCAPLWTDHAERGPVARARFLAWAASRAAVVDLATPAAAETSARALRVRVSAPSSPIALVLTGDDLALRPVAERADLEDAARRLGRAMAANHIEDNHRLDAFARSAPKGRAAPWLSLTPSQLVIVPRLSALARLGEVASEIEAAANGAPVRWVHRP